ncbi:hypothetical protein [Anaeromicropila populeti]|nr:hypothetical protein [Anaeromicropila populeti]
MKQLLDANDKNMEGGWSYNQGDVVFDKNEDVKRAFDKATDGLVGSDYEPIFYIGSQVKTGNNYAIFCSVAPVVPDAEKNFCIAYISVNFDGSAELTDDVEVDLTAEDENSKETTEEQIPNPFTEVSTLAETRAMTGFEMEIPDTEKPYTKIVITVIDGNMIEVAYITEDDADRGYYIRKAEGAENVSGDANEYAQTEIEQVGDTDVTLKGEDSSWSVAAWSSDGYTYAIGCQNHPMTKEQILKREQFLGHLIFYKWR